VGLIVCQISGFVPVGRKKVLLGGGCFQSVCLSFSEPAGVVTGSVPLWSGSGSGCVPMGFA